MKFLAIALAAFTAVGCNRNDRDNVNNPNNTTENRGTSGVADNRISDADRDFVNDLAIDGMAEVELGRLAVERAASPDVKNFGQMMIDDHTKAGDKLKAVASKHNITVPMALDNKHVDMKNDLAKANGAEFDRKYMDQMVKGHEEVVNKLESRVNGDGAPEKSDNAVTMDINQWAADSHPVVKGHLERAKTIEKGLSKR